MDDDMDDQVPFSQEAMRHQRQRRRRGKIFSDPVHEIIRLDPIHVDVIDTPQYQRLRDLHQLGLTHLVFPGAVHSRFEHSLGVGFKSFEVADRIFRTQGHELRMSKDDVKNVSLAGLCHDLGHGPFSHVWEYEFLPRRLGSLQEGSAEWTRLKKWKHEDMSGAILTHLVDENQIEGISSEDIRKICSLIKGDGFQAEGYLYDIVANKRNGVDVDKFDYLQRDALMCGVDIGCSFRRLLMLTKVLDNQIAYKKTKSVEFMVCDALVEADQALGFSRASSNAEDMMKKFTSAEVAACHPQLRPEDVIVSTSKIDFTAGGGNPLDSIRFFHTSDDTEAFPMDPRQVLGIIPEFHQEHIVRAYTPRTEPGFKERVEDAFQRWCRRYFGSNTQMATPARKPQQQQQPEALTAREGGTGTGAGTSTADGGTGKGVKRARGLFSQEEDS
eukprot:XP_001696780.1 predicted protein [Chlamydomonas reinhardtii]